MNVTLRHTKTGLIALAAAGLFAAGTVGKRANELHGESAGIDVERATGIVQVANREATAPACERDCS